MHVLFMSAETAPVCVVPLGSKGTIPTAFNAVGCVRVFKERGLATEACSHCLLLSFVWSLRAHLAQAIRAAPLYFGAPTNGSHAQTRTESACL